MAQERLMRFDIDGILIQHDPAADDVTFVSFTVDGVNGPVLSGTGLDLMTQNISNSGDIDFDDPSANTIEQTAGALVIDDIMGKDRENLMTTAGSVTFPVVTDTAGELDAFRLPALAGAPTAAPTNGGEGHQVWDSTNDTLYIWDGTGWVNQSIVNEARLICNEYTAGEILTANQAVYISAADEVSLAVASGGTGATARLVGFTSTAAAAAAPVNVCSEGVLGGFSGLTPGARYWLDTTSGAIVSAPPTGAGNNRVQAGYAKSATELHIHIEQVGRLR